MKNNWNIRISESEMTQRGFSVSVENNGKYVGAIKGTTGSFAKAVEAGKNIILSAMMQLDNKKKHAKDAQAFFTKEYMFNKMFTGIYGVGIHYDENSEPFLNVLMDTDNKTLMTVIPNEIRLVGTPYSYRINKEKSEPIVAQVGNIKDNSNHIS